MAGRLPRQPPDSRRAARSRRRLAWPRIRAVALTFLGVLAVTLLGGTARLAFSAPTAETVRVAGVSWSREPTSAPPRCWSSSTRSATRSGTVICFDADFPALMRQAHDVDLVLVPSDDWQEYGQIHTEKATPRAVENGYSLVRPDSRGLSRVLDPQGRTLAQAGFFTTDQQTVVAEVPVEGIRTVYATIGDVFAWSSIGALLLLVAGAARSGARRRRPRD